MFKKRYELVPLDTTSGNALTGVNTWYRSKRRAKAAEKKANANSATFVYNFYWRVYDVESGSYL